MFEANVFKIIAAADLVVLSKVDLLPRVDFDVGRCIDHARTINPQIETMQVSARHGTGMAERFAWIGNARSLAPQTRSAEPANEAAHA